MAVYVKISLRNMEKSIVCEITRCLEVSYDFRKKLLTASSLRFIRKNNYFLFYDRCLKIISFGDIVLFEILHHCGKKLSTACSLCLLRGIFQYPELK